MRIPISIYDRHIHLSSKDAEKLFGRDYKFQKKKDLAQAGKYICQETLAIRGPQGDIDGVSIIQPYRSKTQLEILASDNNTLGIQAPLRLSGNLKGSASLNIIGPEGSIHLNEGVIVAQRHLHATVAEVEELGLRNGDIINIQISGIRALVFQDVIVRARDNYSLDFHIDIEEANTAGVKIGDWGEIV